MNDYEDQYFIVFTQNPDSGGYSDITYQSGYERESIFSAGKFDSIRPLRFLTLDQEENREEGISDTLGDVHQFGTKLVVKKWIRDFLFPKNIHALQMHPAIIIDNQEEWHEQYQYLHFYEKLDCLDLNKSECTESRWGEGEDEYEYDVEKYAFEKSVLDSIEESQRLAFCIGGKVMVNHTFFHRQLVDFIVQNRGKGFRFFPVSEYKEGFEFARANKLMSRGINVIDLPA